MNHYFPTLNRYQLRCMHVHSSMVSALLVAALLVSLSLRVSSQQVTQGDIRIADVLVVLKADQDGKLKIDEIVRGRTSELEETLKRMDENGFRAKAGSRYLFLRHSSGDLRKQKVRAGVLLRIFRKKYVFAKNGIDLDWRMIGDGGAK